jgi:glutamine phosphoribosylpyrophosphate amidotransferase
MCGVIGYWPVSPAAEALGAFAALFDESRVRGRHAYGLANHVGAWRTFQAADVPRLFDPEKPTVAHARYSTSGDWRTLANNQPLVVGDRALAFNGVIHMGTKAEFEAAYGVACASDNDGEVFLRRLEAGETAQAFLQRIPGSFAGVWLEGGRLWAVRNLRRPLWRCDAYGARWYASTRDIFRRAGFQVETATELVPGQVEAAA